MWRNHHQICCQKGCSGYGRLYSQTHSRRTEQNEGFSYQDQGENREGKCHANEETGFPREYDGCGTCALGNGQVEDVLVGGSI